MTDQGTTAAVAHDELPVYFGGGDRPLFGVITRPVGPPGRIGVLLLPGAVYVTSTNKNRTFVKLARELAGGGHRSLRIDYQGVGESPGVITNYALDDPNPSDVTAALDCLLDAGAERLVLVGSCFGARAAMHAAAAHAQLLGMVLLAPPTGDSGRGETPEAMALGPLFQAGIEILSQRKAPTLLLYGDHDAYFRAFNTAASGPLAHLLQEGSSITVRTVPGDLHGLTHVAAQKAFIDIVAGWINDLAIEPVDA